MRGASVHKEVVCLLGPLPASVAVHREVATHHAGDPARPGPQAPVLHGLQIVNARLRWGVTAIGDAVNDNVLRPKLGGQFDQGTHVHELGVHTTIGGKPQQVHAPAGCESLAQDVHSRQTHMPRRR